MAKPLAIDSALEQPESWIGQNRDLASAAVNSKLMVGKCC
jgi:hypothetical protein